MDTALEADGIAVPVRIPVELGPVLHRRLMRWCRDTATQLDVDGVTRAQVVECLVELLDEDPRVAGAVLRRLGADASVSIFS
jgi:hypothetical protein